MAKKMKLPPMFTSTYDALTFIAEHMGIDMDFIEDTILEDADLDFDPDTLDRHLLQHIVCGIDSLKQDSKTLHSLLEKQK